MVSALRRASFIARQAPNSAIASHATAAALATAQTGILAAQAS
jgi:hypothetical protein